MGALISHSGLIQSHHLGKIATMPKQVSFAKFSELVLVEKSPEDDVKKLWYTPQDIRSFARNWIAPKHVSYARFSELIQVEKSTEDDLKKLWYSPEDIRSFARDWITTRGENRPQRAQYGAMVQNTTPPKHRGSRSPDRSETKS